MSRPPKYRRVEYMPELTYFKPAGIPLIELEEIGLTVEELESIRLKDVEGLDQEVCAERMGVSRPTYHRILSSARVKIARALVEGKAIRVEGGYFQITNKRFKCKECGHEWDAPGSCERVCPKCSNVEVLRVDGMGGPHGNQRRRRRGPAK
ncbi:MAG: DUF134 domain-containing protein [Clostridiales bacterium]|nr:DUF134 domain-containing protein [Clostridiales bacterium]MCF8023749.1 DUF134 domain-containing protein [Clostridiales bacterium]